LESQKTNIKRARLILNGETKIRDIYIVDGVINAIRGEVRQSVFSGVYEMDAEGLFAVPFFTDSGCFALGLKEGELPKLSWQEYKRYGFFSFVSMLHPLDNPARLFEQREFARAFEKNGMRARYLTGGTRNKIYHLGENIYEDIVKSEHCVGASALVDDDALGIDTTRFTNMANQVSAARYDTERRCVTIAIMGNLAKDLFFIEEAIKDDIDRVIPAFVNRNKKLLKASLNFVTQGGHVILMATGEKDRMHPDVVPLSQALVRIYEEKGDLDGVLTASYSGGHLPKKNNNTLDVRGEIVNLSSELKEAVGFGIPIEEVLKTVTQTPIAVFGLNSLNIAEERPARFLLVDETLKTRYIVEGNSVYPPENYKTPVLFFS